MELDLALSASRADLMLHKEFPLRPKIVTNLSELENASSCSKDTSLLGGPGVNIEDMSDDSASSYGQALFSDSESIGPGLSSRSHSPSGAIVGGSLSPPGIARRPRLLSESSTVYDAGHLAWQKHSNSGRRVVYGRDWLLRTSEDIQADVGPIRECGLVEWLSSSEDRSCGISGKEKGHNYIPVEQLNMIMSEENISEELNRMVEQGEVDKSYIEGLATLICHNRSATLLSGKRSVKSFRKIFAVLLLSRNGKYIRQFIDEDVGDMDLPLIPRRHGKQWSLFRNDAHGKPLVCTEAWVAHGTREFENKQWCVLVPYFDQDKPNQAKHFVFNSDHILPFMSTIDDTDDPSPAPKDGGYGCVHMVRIHPQHHNFHQVGVDDQGFAIKELKQHRDATRETFGREVKALGKFSGAVEHDHVVTLLATYEQAGSFFLVFPRGQGDLFDCWMRNKPDHSHRHMLWIARQCEGLAEALLLLHRWGPAKARTLPGPSDCSKCRAGYIAVPRSHHLHHRIRSPSRGPTSDSGQLSPLELDADVDSRPAGGSTVRRWSSTATQGRSTRYECAHMRLGDCKTGQVRGRSPPAALQSAPTASNDGVVEDEREPTAARRVPQGMPIYEPRKDFGRHGDIKPQNIIWYRARESHFGMLKLADFGHAELNSQWTRTLDRDVAFSRTHRPPECDLVRHTIGQKYDVWSLGCVFLEFVAWAVGGSQLVDEFGDARKAWDQRVGMHGDAFFHVIPAQGVEQEERAEVKPQVIEFILRLRTDEACCDYLQELLDLAQQHMLVVEKDDRWDSCQVHGRLQELLEKCEGEKGEMFTTKNTRQIPAGVEVTC